ncbi:MAG: hypothetical protein J4F42_15200 [Desulfurellaceae bacterium]|nr:hypothetical protein [Desulfurellaceae bacterium]
MLLEAFDTPGDAGGSVVLRWQALPVETAEARYQVLHGQQPDGPFSPLVEFAATSHYETDQAGPWWVWGSPRPDWHRLEVELESDGAAFFRLVLLTGQDRFESRTVSATPRANLFRWSKLNNLVLVLAFGATVLVSIRRARNNPDIFLRRIPGLEAVEEAVGRATEMGRPVLYLTGSGELNGSGDPSNLSTIAATVILGEVSKRVASYGAELRVPHRSAIVMAICQEMVKEAYLTVGRPDAYTEETNFFITQDQFAYTAAVDGIMLRDKPAANIFMGYYYAESLLLAETGASTGAIQIAGTDADHQLPFFITTCDYTLIGEELYAASAYLSREPALVGTLRSQDLGKAVLLGVLLVGSLALSLTEFSPLAGVETVVQIFSDFR